MTPDRGRWLRAAVLAAGFLGVGLAACHRGAPKPPPPRPQTVTSGSTLLVTAPFVIPRDVPGVLPSRMPLCALRRIFDASFRTAFSSSVRPRP